MKKTDTTDKIINNYLSKGIDFGFTEIDTEEDQKEIHEKTLTIEELKGRLNEIEEIVMPLLANLLKTAKSPKINWPDREGPIKEMIDKILKLTRT